MPRDPQADATPPAAPRRQSAEQAPVRVPATEPGVVVDTYGALEPGLLVYEMLQGLRPDGSTVTLASWLRAGSARTGTGSGR